MIIILAVLVLAVSRAAFAFHGGGAGACEGCHTIHNSLNGNARTSAGGASLYQGQPYLLLGSDPSSTCLNCHKDITDTFHVMSNATGAQGVPAQMTPGGDFAWLNVTTTYVTSLLVTGTNHGYRHGHNIVAADYSLAASPVFATAPGGNYPSAKLGCTSCHDPHGSYRVNASYDVVRPGIGTNAGAIGGSGSDGTRLPSASKSVGVYRMLAGADYLPSELRGNNALAFAYPPPFAFAPSTYNRSESVTDTRVAYGNGMSEWCANCHGGIHGDGTPTSQPHPTGNTLSGGKTSALSNLDSEGITIAARYNAYISSGNLTGSASGSYTSMVPYEEGLAMNSTSYASLASRAVSDGSKKGGPGYYPGSGNERVMCLTCHRAHASAWPKALRWNAEYGQYLVVQGVYPGIDAPVAEAQAGEYNLGYIQAQVQRSFYDRPASIYAAYQKSLCKKCHNTSSDS